MKRLTTLLYIILCFYILSGVLVIIRILSELYALFDIYISESNLDLTEIIFSILKLGFIIYLTYHIYRFSRTVNRFNEKSFFNKENGTSFKRTGKAIVQFVIINLISSFIYAGIDKTDGDLSKLPEEFIANIVLLMMALFLLIISNLIQNGYQLKKENDLTI